MLCEFASGARGTFEASRTIVGPESQMAFEVYGTKGALGWNLERMNELRALPREDELHTGYTHGLRRRPLPVPRRTSCPAAPTAIGFEDLVVIEDYEFLPRGRRGAAVRARASTTRSRAVAVQAALLARPSRAPGTTCVPLGEG